LLETLEEGMTQIEFLRVGTASSIPGDIVLYCAALPLTK